MNNIATYTTRQKAQQVIDRLDTGLRELAYGEYACPDYTIRKVRGKDTYYIHVRYYYYAGTLCAKRNGPLGEDAAFFATN